VILWPIDHVFVYSTQIMRGGE